MFGLCAQYLVDNQKSAYIPGQNIQFLAILPPHIPPYLGRQRLSIEGKTEYCMVFTIYIKNALENRLFKVAHRFCIKLVCKFN